MAQIRDLHRTAYRLGAACPAAHGSDHSRMCGYGRTELRSGCRYQPIRRDSSALGWLYPRRHAPDNAPLDDIGAQLLFRFVSAAYERRPLGVASHWPFDKVQWDRFLPEHTTAVSLLDRLLHHANVVVTDGDSYRMRQARARGGTVLTKNKSAEGWGHLTGHQRDCRWAVDTRPPIRRRASARWPSGAGAANTQQQSRKWRRSTEKPDSRSGGPGTRTCTFVGLARVSGGHRAAPSHAVMMRS